MDGVDPAVEHPSERGAAGLPDGQFYSALPRAVYPSPVRGDPTAHRSADPGVRGSGSRGRCGIPLERVAGRGPADEPPVPSRTGGPPLLAVLSLGEGFRFDEQVPRAALPRALQWIHEQGRSVEALLAAREEGDVLPWDDFEGGTPRDRLWGQFQKAEAEPRAARELPAPAGGPSEPPRVRKPSVTFGFWAWLPPPDAVRPGATLARALLRDFFAACPEEVRFYAGSPELIRPLPGHGLALLRASFYDGLRADTMETELSSGTSSRMLLRGPLGRGDEPDPDDCWYLARFRPRRVPARRIR